MEDEPVYPPWYEMVPWLSRHRGKAAHLTCRRCDLKKSYAVDDILAKEGDIAVKSLPGLAARLLNCPHIAETISWKRCLIRAEIRSILDPSKMSPHIKIPNDMDRLPEIPLKDVPSYYAVYGACRCGRIHYIDVRPFVRRKPDITTKHMAARLACQRCGNKDGNALLYMHMPR